LRVYLGVVVKLRDVADEPKLIGIQKHDFSSVLVRCRQIRLVGEVAGVCNAWSELRR
jgi:hypothetical protein